MIADDWCEIPRWQRVAMLMLAIACDAVPRLGRWATGWCEVFRWTR